MDSIFCYSGTGNSLACAKQVSEFFGRIPVTMITQELIEEKCYVNCDFCVILFPSYAYGLPASVRRFLKSAAFNVNYLALITTYGSHHGGNLAEAVRLIKHKKQKTHFATGIKSVENYVPMFGLAKEEKIQRLVKKQRQQTTNLCEDLQQRIQNKVFLFRPASGFISALFKSVKGLFAKRYKVTSDCIGCGICQRLCPARAITIKDSRPVFNAKNCDHCQGCLQLCPKKAIRFSKIKPDSRRYIHPDVTLNELIKRGSIITDGNESADKG